MERKDQDGRKRSSTMKTEGRGFFACEQKSGGGQYNCMTASLLLFCYATLFSVCA